MKKQVSIIWLIISAVLIILTGALLAYVYWQRSEMRNFKEHINIENEREKLEEEYTAIFQEYRQYENNRVWINNDSLIQKLDREKTRVQRLLEELRNRKNIDALTIDSLHKELQCLRNNIKIYQTTIDSLNRENRQLKAEKNDALSRYQKATREADQLQKDNYELNEKVNLAARLEAINIEIRTLNKRGRKSTDKDKVSRLKINFSIARNTMAPTGEKRVYVCIKKPDGTTLVKDRGNTFFLAGKEYYYSLQQIIDYTGNNKKMYFTWQVEEYLPSGLYRIDIFADNQLIGAESFSLND